MADDDPVVQEYPIILNTLADEKLYLLQFPGVGKDRNVKDVSNVRIKTESRILEVDEEIEEKGDNYDRNRASKWKNSNIITYKGNINDDTNYLIGTFVKDQLNIAKVDVKCQLRPNLKYIDVNDMEVNQDLHMKRQEMKSKETKTVQMTVKSADDTAPKYSGALQSFRKSEIEPFKNLSYHPENSAESWSKASQVFPSMS
ncbi:hypothetical protein CANCADRAFT_132840 [Tortispora caseinolytica NRRL Y-17796]|uniref:Uncharacterized protein n=1 Tax=Tortispora caseinolytica NRRL Y-17796 TaxID=767744 RepID=A0A1E4TBB9_9ASCO|nr:hypothetical protein CANCADRAFT_132840 [Tortispora caseinolytica NRRL Y-17796]